jgi:hypothetical protein
MMNLNVGVAIPALRKQSTYKQVQGYSVKYQAVQRKCNPALYLNFFVNL